MKRPDNGILRYLLISLMIGVLIFAIYDHLTRDSLPPDFMTLIEQIDQLSAEGRLSEATDRIRSAGNRDYSSYQYLLLLKRIYALRETEAAPSLLVRYARRAAARYPGKEEFRMLLCRGLIDTGRPEEAFKQASEHLRSEKYLGIRVEAAVAGRISLSEADIEAASSNRYHFAGLVRMAAGEKSVDLYRSAAGEWDVDEFYADSALLLASGGDIAGANDLMRTFIYQRFPRLSLQIAYDAADAAHGLAVLKVLDPAPQPNDPYLKLFKAEFMLLQDEQEAALKLYRSIIEINPEYSIIPWLNAAQIDRESRGELLTAGVELFPDTVALLEQAAEYHYQRDETGEARALFNRIIEIEPEHPAARIRLADTRLGPDSRGGDARIWDAYRLEPGGTELGLFLAWRLYGRRDQHGLAMLSELQRNRNGANAEVIEGLHALLAGDYARGSESFGGAFNRSRNWEYQFDRALLEMYAHNYDQAIDYFQEVEVILRDSIPSDAAMRSKVWSSIAECHIALGNPGEASRAVDFALDLDRGNLRAALLRSSMDRQEQ